MFKRSGVLAVLIFSFCFADYVELWGQLLRKYTQLGTKNKVEQLVMVDYKRLKSDSAWIDLLQQLEDYDTSTLLSESQKLAFWINVYNIGAVKIIVDNYPLNSILDKSGFLNPVWDQKIIQVGSGNYSLGYIEHKILREMNEPRIHFAIVCAVVSCPNLRQQAFNPALIYNQLDDQMQLFLTNESKGLKINYNDKKIYLSSIFKWFSSDFGDIRQYLSQNLPEKANIIEDPAYEIHHLHYDWQLNSLTIN